MTTRCAKIEYKGIYGFNDKNQVKGQQYYFNFMLKMMMILLHIHVEDDDDVATLASC
jgi:hypothetical protein